MLQVAGCCTQRLNIIKYKKKKKKREGEEIYIPEAAAAVDDVVGGYDIPERRRRPRQSIQQA